MELTKLAAAMRLIDLKDGQRGEFILRDGRRIGWTVRKVKGRARWRLEVDTYPDGTQILTAGPPVK